MPVALLDGSTFMVSDDLGDCNGIGTEGYFFLDTRFLSVFRLRLNGNTLERLSADTRSYYSARFFLVPPAAVFVTPEISVMRNRALGRGVHEDLHVSNHGAEPVEITLEIELDADFRDLFAVKEGLAALGETSCSCDGRRIRIDYRYGSLRRATVIEFAQPVQLLTGTPHRAVLRQTIPAKDTWHVCIQIAAVTDGEHRPKYACDTLERPLPEMRESFDQWRELAPKLRTDWDALAHTYERSIIALGALRFYPGPGEGAVPAAGLPWFMALFGRDTLITALQSLPYLPELAYCTLRALARRQARHDDAFRDAEPGKILHEQRQGELTLTGDRPHGPYYGTVDATPLFLVLLEAYERWTGDQELVRELLPNALAATQWLDRHEPLVSYRKRSEKGLDNQSWKDSWNSMQFHDGRLAQPPIAAVEVQGYAIAAYRSVAALATRVWHDTGLASQARQRALALQAALEQHLWLPQQRHYALALDGEGRPVDSLTSNMGHLLWSEACNADRAARICELLMQETLFSGWGVRTLSTDAAGYNPISYHNGTVWPHDNSLIAAGLACYGFRREANRIATAMVEAAAQFNYCLPEVFAGFARAESGFPVEYPTASAPQAWASGAPLLLLTAMLALRATPEGELQASPVLPGDIAFIALDGIHHRGNRYTLRADAGGCELRKR